MGDPVRILVVGLGNMGASHASAYHRMDGFEIVGLCSRTIKSKEIPAELAGYPLFEDYEAALAELKPDAVSINTWPWGWVNRKAVMTPPGSSLRSPPATAWCMGREMVAVCTARSWVCGSPVRLIAPSTWSVAGGGEGRLRQESRKSSMGRSVD